MFKFVPILLFSSFLISAVDAALSECSSACQTTVASIQFNTSSIDNGYYVAVCTELLRVQSEFLCMQHYCTDTEIKVGLEQMNKECVQYGFVELLPWSIISDISDEQAQSYPQITLDDIKSTTVYDTPVSVSQSLFNLSLKTMVEWDHSLVTRANYGYAMFGFWAVVILISMTARMSNFFIGRRRSRQATPKNSRPSLLRSLRLASKRYVTTPALMTYHAVQPVGWCTVPLRLQSFTIAAFVIINVVLCCVSYEAFENNLYWPNTSTQTWRYLSDRTGVISISNLPLLFAFAMRNNVLMWLTGWDFGTFNLFHRWVARVATFEAIIHSIGYTVEAVLDGGKAELIEEWAEQYWWMGAIATIMMSFLCVFSLYPIRRHLYELFLIVHIILAVIFLVGMWYHISIFEGQYNGFIWPCIAIWVFDGVLRIARLAYLNFFSYSSTVTYDSDANVMRIDAPVWGSIRPAPGTHYYLYAFNGLKFWEGHPFTLASWRHSTAASGKKTTILSFVIRPYDSFTARLKKSVQNSGVQVRGSNSEFDKPEAITASTSPHSQIQRSVHVAIEGPYGHNTDLTRYNSVLFVIGGSGISVALSHLQALHESLTSTTSSPSRLRHVHLVWAVRDSGLYEDIYKHKLATWLDIELSPLAAQANFHIDLHVTSSMKEARIAKESLEIQRSSRKDNVTVITQHNDDANSDRVHEINAASKEIQVTSTEPSSPPPPSSALTGVARVNLHTTRPEIHDVVLSSAREWCVRGERLAVVCCGPGSMADDTRAAVVSAYKAGYEEIEFLSELFSW